jgi:hypothetical protein
MEFSQCKYDKWKYINVTSYVYSLKYILLATNEKLELWKSS